MRFTRSTWFFTICCGYFATAKPSYDTTRYQNPWSISISGKGVDENGDLIPTPPPDYHINGIPLARHPAVAGAAIIRYQRHKLHSENVEAKRSINDAALGLGPQSSMLVCPVNCNCTAIPTLVDCKRRNMTRPPMVGSTLSYTTTLDLTGNMIRRVPGLFFTSRNITTLHLSENGLVTLEQEAFCNLPNLRAVYLEQNNIVHLSKYVFANNTELMLIDLSINPLTYVDKYAFAKLIKLSILFVRDCRLKSLAFLVPLIANSLSSTWVKDFSMNVTSVIFDGSNNHDIMTVDDDVLAAMGSVGTLFISNTSMICHCLPAERSLCSQYAYNVERWREYVRDCLRIRRSSFSFDVPTTVATPKFLTRATTKTHGVSSSTTTTTTTTTTAATTLMVAAAATKSNVDVVRNNENNRNVGTTNKTTTAATTTTTAKPGIIKIPASLTNTKKTKQKAKPYYSGDEYNGIDDDSYDEDTEEEEEDDDDFLKLVFKKLENNLKEKKKNNSISTSTRKTTTILPPPLPPTTTMMTTTNIATFSSKEADQVMMNVYFSLPIFGVIFFVVVGTIILLHVFTKIVSHGYKKPFGRRCKNISDWYVKSDGNGRYAWKNKFKFLKKNQQIRRNFDKDGNDGGDNDDDYLVPVTSNVTGAAAATATATSAADASVVVTNDDRLIADVSNQSCRFFRSQDHHQSASLSQIEQRRPFLRCEEDNAICGENRKNNEASSKTSMVQDKSSIDWHKLEKDKIPSTRACNKMSSFSGGVITVAAAAAAATTSGVNSSDTFNANASLLIEDDIRKKPVGNSGNNNNNNNNSRLRRENVIDNEDGGKKRYENEMIFSSRALPSIPTTSNTASSSIPISLSSSSSFKFTNNDDIYESISYEGIDDFDDDYENEEVVDRQPSATGYVSVASLSNNKNNGGGGGDDDDENLLIVSSSRTSSSIPHPPPPSLETLLSSSSSRSSFSSRAVPAISSSSSFSVLLPSTNALDSSYYSYAYGGLGSRFCDNNNDNRRQREVVETRVSSESENKTSASSYVNIVTANAITVNGDESIDRAQDDDEDDKAEKGDVVIETTSAIDDDTSSFKAAGDGSSTPPHTSSFFSSSSASSYESNASETKPILKHASPIYRNNDSIFNKQRSPPRPMTSRAEEKRSPESMSTSSTPLSLAAKETTKDQKIEIVKNILPPVIVSTLLKNSFEVATATTTSTTAAVEKEEDEEKKEASTTAGPSTVHEIFSWKTSSLSTMQRRKSRLLESNDTSRRSIYDIPKQSSTTKRVCNVNTKKHVGFVIPSESRSSSSLLKKTVAAAVTTTATTTTPTTTSAVVVTSTVPIAKPTKSISSSYLPFSYDGSYIEMNKYRRKI